MTREEIEEVRRRAYETIANIDETLERTRPDPAVEQRQQPTSHYRGYEVETMANMLKASEARIAKRLDEEVRRSLVKGQIGSPRPATS